MTSVPRILIADDQRDVLEALRLLAKGEGYQADTVDSPAAALKALEQRDYDTVLIDLNYARDTTSGEEGLDLLTRPELRLFWTYALWNEAARIATIDSAMLYTNSIYLSGQIFGVQAETWW